MWCAHLLFAWNFYMMVRKRDEIELPVSISNVLNTRQNAEKQSVVQ